eukprot:TRINITY_DN25237_c0_g1_i1.p1 TRINITY_DN25237_c0_g1~~TRINITY_DN25237_c0_g1_i1.p1  ORF type:complete len:1030 (+),score=110.86 TRINITY_DN25237_c0_g1_i1:1913-5002(+)
MPRLLLRGVAVEFPLEPYPCQIAFMDAVLVSLIERRNALLESPTGTGKTLSLLCATLAWLVQQRATEEAIGIPPPSPGADGANNFGLPSQSSRRKVIYASRTHSQLSQVIQEFKRTAYSNVLTMAVLGSREQLCVHPKVSQQKGGAQNALCRGLTRAHRCVFHNGTANYKRSLATEPMDIEDLVQAGKQNTFCPFFLERELQVTADIVFMPYNYLVDPSLRASLGVSLRNAAVVIDEAHNVGAVMAECYSSDLSSMTLAGCIREVQKAMEVTRDSAGSAAQDDPSGAVSGGLEDVAQRLQELDVLKKLLLNLEKRVHDEPLEAGDATSGRGPALIRSGEWLLDLLAEQHLTHSSWGVFLGVVDKAVQALVQDAELAGGVRITRAHALETLIEMLRRVFAEPRETLATSYRAIIQNDTDASSRRRGGANLIDTAAGRTLSLWCLDPQVCMRRLVQDAQPHCFVLTSGTLAPLESFAAELGVPFEVQLENEHVVSPAQVLATVVRSGPAGVTLNSSYLLREKPEYKKDLGQLLLNLCRIVPHGLLVFFSSYTHLESCVEHWKAHPEPPHRTIWESFSKYKLPVVEPRDSSKLSETIRDYAAHVRTTGAMLLAVCRGKVSEGLDFADAMGRCVVIAGLPYPNKADLKVRLKQAHLDNRKTHGPRPGITGSQWYQQQATRAVNQALGRVIRHRKDFGAMVLCDERFSEKRTTDALSKWLRPYLKVAGNFGELTHGLARFFRENGLTAPLPAPVSLPILPPSTTNTTTASNSVTTATAAGQDSERRLEGDAPLVIGDRARTFRDKIATVPDFLESLGATPFSRTEVPDAAVKVSAASNSSDPQQFLSLVRSVLGPRYTEFRNMLQTFKKSKEQDSATAYHTLEKSALKLFANNQTLLVGFAQFVPVAYRAQYLKATSHSAQAAVAEPPTNVRMREIDLVSGRPAKQPRTTLTLAVPLQVPPAAVPPVNKPTPFSAAGQKSSSCVICLATCVDPHSARCGHVCCLACWDKWLSERLECPVCRSRVRLKLLTRLHL